jgi:hypothetical protein
MVGDSLVKIRVLRKTTGEVQTMDIEDYVRGVVPKEMCSWWPQQALRAQAVAARTYALYFKHYPRHGNADVCDTTHCQAYGDTRYASTDEAVEKTRGVVATYLGKIRPTFYSAACGGKTSADWGEWLKATDCPCGMAVNGHRQGMCQNGARVLADRGLAWGDIIKYYYNMELRQNYNDEFVNNGTEPDPPPEEPDMEEKERLLAEIRGYIMQGSTVNSFLCMVRVVQATLIAVGYLSAAQLLALYVQLQPQLQQVIDGREIQVLAFLSSVWYVIADSMSLLQLNAYHDFLKSKWE